MMALPFDMWTVISLLGTLLQAGLCLLLVGAAVYLRAHRPVAIALVVAALAAGWGAVDGVLSWTLWNVLGPALGYSVAEGARWVLRPLRWVASLAQWVALAYAALAGRGPGSSPVNDDPFANVS